MPDLSFIERAVACADVNALRMALFQATRDPDIAAVKAVRARGAASDTVAFTPEGEDLVRRKAVEFLNSGFDSGALPTPTEAEVAELAMMAEARELQPEEMIMRVHLPAFAEMPYRARWTAGAEVPNGFVVAIVGAGFAGIAMGVQLEQLGIPFKIFERRAEVGGVWSANTYPDARVDTLSSSYEFGFEKRFPWTEYFARQSEVQGYLDHVSHKYGVHEHVEFGAAVTSARYDDDAKKWKLTVQRASEVIDFEANVVITASGLFSTPRELPVEGAADFAGKIVHTTQWDSAIDYEGKRVAIIGNGSTGVQLLSQIAATAESVVVHQRTPQWITPRPRYGDPVPEELQWLLQNMPFYWNWNKYVAGLSTIDLRDLLVPDESWIQSGGGVNERNDGLRDALVKYVEMQVDGRKDLLDELIPDYPPMTRRPVVDNNWYASLLRENVELVTTPIERITTDGVQTADGVLRQADLIVAAVGFETEKYLWPTEYYGARGVSLEEAWSTDGAQAHLGMTVPDFPNLFMLYGPNSQPVASGSGFPGWLEIWSKYIAEAIVELVEGGYSSMAVRREAFETYNALLHKEAGNLIYLSQNSATSKNYYLNEWGRLQVNVPWTGEQFFSMCAQLKSSDFDFTDAK
ncbi:NAD(P)/FAD-dependent oxidoreductase [Rhodococcus sovatensis]|uniref:NAD(P)/FAD-dependent oxidoreductase n=1 Tax=Rhodococcus sovatensis TaxID=1805840 RepID=A0ABZ2PQN8_9NOCA